MANPVPPTTCMERDKPAGTLSVLCSILLCFFILPPENAAIGQEKANKPTRRSATNQATRDSRPGLPDYERELRNSLKRIPWDSLSRESREKIKSVVRNLSLFRQMPGQAVYCDAEMYRYLLDHPDLVVGFWDHLGVTQISLREWGEDRYLMKETTGTVAKIEVLYRTDAMCIVYARGQYKGPFAARAIEGESVLVLRNRYGFDADGEPFVACILDVFICIDHFGADFLARLFSTTLGRIADGNFEQTVAFVGQVSDAASINPEALRRITHRVKGVRDDVRNDFTELVEKVAVQSLSRSRESALSRRAGAERAGIEAPDAMRAEVAQTDVVGETACPFETKEPVAAAEDDLLHAFFQDDATDVAEAETPLKRTTFSMPCPPGTGAVSSNRTEESAMPETMRRGAVFGTPRIAHPTSAE